MLDIFNLIIYQPFFNLLVFLYWLLNLITNGNADMGIAVIILTIIIRILLLPLAFAGEKSEKDRREIAEKIKEIEIRYDSEPILKKKYKSQIMKKSMPVVVGELLTLLVQVAVALMLWRIFQTGLTGDDMHFLYSFMPEVAQPFNLVFWNTYDLTHTSFTLNLIQSVLIFVLETLSLYYSPYPVTRAEVIRLQLVLPIVSFIIFMGLPAGKKLFIITTLLISILLTLWKIIRWKFDVYKNKVEQPPTDSEEKIVVEIK